MGEPYYLGGELTSCLTTAPILFPYTGEVFKEVCLAGVEDLSKAVDFAASAFAETKIIPGYKRSAMLHKLANLIEENRDEFVSLIIHESGKPKKQAVIEVERAITVMQISAEETLRIGGELFSLDRNLHNEGYTGYYQHVPSGPVLCITPFNFPLSLVCHKIGPAIAAGCSFVLKPSSQTPLSALLLGKLILETGYPKRAVNIVPARGNAAERLVRDSRFSVLSFTGSPIVGWRLKEIFSGRRVSLELGGNAAAIVHKDADLPYAAKRIALGGTVNAGQSCISVQRVYIHEDVYDACISLIVDEMKNLVVGDPRDDDTDVGPMITELEAKRAEEKMRQAMMKGARLVYGGKREGTVFYPTVLDKTSTEMSISSSEMFAPMIAVSSYTTIDEAIRYVNESRYGLQNGIFTNSLDISTKASTDIESGAVIINDYPTFRADEMPYGGHKLSGVGREGPKYLIEEFMERKLIVTRCNYS